MKSIMIIIKESAKLAKIAGSSVNSLAAPAYIEPIKETPQNHGSISTVKIAECRIEANIIRSIIAILYGKA